MKVSDSKGNQIGLRDLIDTLRDKLIVNGDFKGRTLNRVISGFNAAVSDTLLTLFDSPAPPSKQRAQQPMVARPPKPKRTRRTLAQIEQDSKQASIADVTYSEAIGEA